MVTSYLLFFRIERLWLHFLSDHQIVVTGFVNPHRCFNDSLVVLMYADLVLKACIYIIYIHGLESNTIDNSINFNQPNRPYLPILTHVWVHCIKPQGMYSSRKLPSGVI